MKALIIIVVLALIGWGIWSWMGRDDAPEIPAAGSESVDIFDNDTSTDDSTDDSGLYEDKG